MRDNWLLFGWNELSEWLWQLFALNWFERKIFRREMMESINFDEIDPVQWQTKAFLSLRAVAIMTFPVVRKPPSKSSIKKTWLEWHLFAAKTGKLSYCIIRNKKKKELKVIAYFLIEFIHLFFIISLSHYSSFGSESKMNHVCPVLFTLFFLFVIVVLLVHFSWTFYRFIIHTHLTTGTRMAFVEHIVCRCWPIRWNISFRKIEMAKLCTQQMLCSTHCRN